MLTSCSLCGSKLTDQSPCLLDTTIFGSNYTSVIHQLLEENEKNVICVLESGSICVSCAALLESVDMLLNKLRDLKESLINSYKSFMGAQYDKASEYKQLNQTEHEYSTILKLDNSNSDNLDNINENFNETATQEINDDGHDLGKDDHDFDSNSLHSNSNEEVAEACYDTSSSISPEEETVQVFDFVLEDNIESGEMETLQLELDTSTWSSIFNSADDGHQSFSLKEKFDEWKPKILTLIRDYVKVCNIDLMSVQKCGEFPMIMGYCKFANCTRSIQIKVINVRKLELQYSVEECITSMSNQEDASENRANLSAKVCDYCLKQFLSTDPASEKEAMKNHLRVCHSQPQAQIYSCKCGRRFNKKAARNSHLKRCERVTDVESTMLSCEICHQSFNSVAKLQRHAKTCKATVYCQVCKKDLASGVTLERHMASTHQIQTQFTSERRKYPCDKCEKVFWKKYNLESHSLMHSDIKPFVCDVEGCNKRFKREVTLRQHINTRHQNRIVTLFCALCPAQFKSAGGLKLHMDTIHNLGPGRPRKFDCNRCDKKFKCQADLTIHIVTHTKEKNFACDLCDQKFSRNSSLKDHLNVHRQIFMCKWCNKSFGRDRYLKSHHEICPQGPNGSQKESFTENLLCQIVDEPSSQEKIIVRRENHLIGQDNSLINRTDQLIHQENPLIGRDNHVTGQENALIGQENQLKSPPSLEDQTIQSADIVLNEETCETLLIKDINTETINENMVRNEIAEDELKLNTQPQPSQIVIVSPALKRLEKARKMKVMNNIPKEKILNLRIANTSL